MFSIGRQQRDVKFRNSALSDCAIIANRVLIEFLGQVCAGSLHKRSLENLQFLLLSFLVFVHLGVSVIKERKLEIC